MSSFLIKESLNLVKKSLHKLYPEPEKLAMLKPALMSLTAMIFAEKVTLKTVVSPFLERTEFNASLNTGMFCDFDFVKANLPQQHCHVADARSSGRFYATDPEPRPNFPSGHIPSSKSVPYSQCLDPETKLMKTPEELRKVLEDAGIDLSKPLITTCGSGITACVVALASHLCGKSDTMVYDGSWVEWGQRASPNMIEKN